MKTVSELNDRRRHIRLKSLEYEFLGTPNGIRQIHDISSGGLSFKCTTDEVFPPQWSADIISAGTPIYMKEVPVKFVQERNDALSGIISAPTKNVVVKFVNLDEQTISSLLKLLSYHIPEYQEYKDQ